MAKGLRKFSSTDPLIGAIEAASGDWESYFDDPSPASEDFLRKRGDDLHIAAHAKAANLTLVSNNLKEFERVEGLRLENWI